MSKVIDLCLDLPPSAEEIVESLKFQTLGKGQKGPANYRHIFGVGKARALGLSLAELEQMAEELSPLEFEAKLRERANAVAISLEQFVQQLDDAEVSWGVISAGAGRPDHNERTAAIVARFPHKFVGVAMVDPHQGMKAVRELERAVKELGLGGLYASPYRDGISPNDKKYYPLYAKAVELNIPVFVYTTMNYRTDFPMDLSRPLHLDEVARDFPELTIIAGCGGWPWVFEMVGVARRHQNIYVDTEAHRPKHLATPGSGWEMLLQFGNTLLQDRVVFASGWGNYFLPSEGVIKQVIAEVRSLPLKPEVVEKWLYHNAARLFKRA